MPTWFLWWLKKAGMFLEDAGSLQFWQRYFRPGKDLEKNNEMTKMLEWIPCVEKLNGVELWKETTEAGTQ